MHWRPMCQWKKGELGGPIPSKARLRHWRRCSVPTCSPTWSAASDSCCRAVLGESLSEGPQPLLRCGNMPGAQALDGSLRSVQIRAYEYRLCWQAGGSREPVPRRKLEWRVPQRHQPSTRAQVSPRVLQLCCEHHVDPLSARSPSIADELEGMNHHSSFDTVNASLHGGFWTCRTLHHQGLSALGDSENTGQDQHLPQMPFVLCPTPQIPSA